MTDREKVIKRLDTAVMQMHGPRRYTRKDVEELEMAGWDALALLKEQEPRVMTKEEINKRAESLDPDPIFVQWRETGGTAWIVGSINIIAGMVNAGNRDVRAWTSRPSPEQMRDTPWGPPKEEEDAEVH